MDRTSFSSTRPCPFTPPSAFRLGSTLAAGPVRFSGQPRLDNRRQHYATPACSGAASLALGHTPRHAHLLATTVSHKCAHGVQGGKQSKRCEHHLRASPAKGATASQARRPLGRRSMSILVLRCPPAHHRAQSGSQSSRAVRLEHAPALAVFQRSLRPMLFVFCVRASEVLAAVNGMLEGGRCTLPQPRALARLERTQHQSAATSESLGLCLTTPAHTCCLLPPRGTKGCEHGVLVGEMAWHALPAVARTRVHTEHAKTRQIRCVRERKRGARSEGREHLQRVGNGRIVHDDHLTQVLPHRTYVFEKVAVLPACMQIRSKCACTLASCTSRLSLRDALNPPLLKLFTYAVGAREAGTHLQLASGAKKSARNTLVRVDEVYHRVCVVLSGTIPVSSPRRSRLPPSFTPAANYAHACHLRSRLIYT